MHDFGHMVALHAQQFPVRRWLKINRKLKRGSEIWVVQARVRREAIWVRECVASLWKKPTFSLLSWVPSEDSDVK